MFPQELWFLLEEHPRQWEVSGKEGFPSLPDPSGKFWEEKTITDFPQSQIQGSSAADRAGYFSHQDHRGKAPEVGIKFNPSHLLGEHFSNWKQEQENTWINPSCGTPGTFHLNSIPNQSRGGKSPGFHPHPNIPRNVSILRDPPAQLRDSPVYPILSQFPHPKIPGQLRQSTRNFHFS